MFRTPILSLLAAVLAFTLGGCRKADTHSQATFDSELQYADLLSIQEVSPGISLCTIRDPWRTDLVVMQYLLVPADQKDWDDEAAQQLQERYGQSVVLRTPLQRMAITAACHAWLLSQWDALDHVAVLCDTAFIQAANVQRWMRGLDAASAAAIRNVGAATDTISGNGSTSPIRDGGTATAPNREVLLQAQCDALWISPFENAGLGNVAQLSIPIVYCADYMENTPLGRAEWMRFYGRLVGCAEQADSLFAQVSRRYNALASPHDDGPKLLAELPYGSTWYVPGGCSTSARLYADAGYSYLWSDDKHAGSLSMSKEAVLAKAQQSDCWFIKYNDPERDWTRQTLQQQEPLFDHIQALTKGQVWACNTARSDFFDVTPFRPDSLLASIMAQDGCFFRLLP